MNQSNKLLNSIIHLMLDMLDIDYFYLCFVDGFYDHLISDFMNEKQQQEGRTMRNSIANEQLLIFKDNAHWGKASEPYGYFGIVPIHYHKDMIGYLICSRLVDFTEKEKRIIRNTIQTLEEYFAGQDQRAYCESDFRLCEVIRVFNSNLTLDKKLENVFDKIKSYFNLEAIVYVRNEQEDKYIPEFITEKELHHYQFSAKLRESQIKYIKEKVLGQREIVHIPSFKNTIYFPEHITELFQIDEMFIFPLQNGRKTFGFTVLYGSNLESISANKLQILEQVIIEIGASIAMDIKWNQHISKVMDITILHDIIHRIQYEELDLEEIMKLILDAIPKLTGLKRCIIALKDVTEQYLIPRYANFQTCIKDKIISLDEIDVTDYKVLLSIKTKQPVIIYNPIEDYRCNEEWVKALGNYSSITIPLISENNTVLGIMFLDNADFRIFKEREIEYYKLLGKQIGLIIGNSRVMKEIGNKALKDGLLKIYNRQYIDQKYVELLKQYKQKKATFSVMMIDLDYFKRINDTYGHPFGDKVLRKVTEVIQQNIRGQDIIGRYGGEEIMVFLPMTPIDISYKVAERIRKAVEDTVFEYNIKITLSIGLALCDELAFIEQSNNHNVIQFADMALYRAKQNGRNTICVYNDLQYSS